MGSQSENVLNIMKEGNFVKIYNLTAQNRICCNSQMAQLSAGNRTNFEKMKASANNFDRFIKRQYFDFSHNDLYEFDMIGCVVKIYQKNQDEMELFVLNLIGNKKELISIKVMQSKYCIHFNSMRESTVYSIKNLKYNGYDNNLSLHSTASYRRSQFVSNAHKDKELKKAKEFVLSQEGQQNIQSVIKHINTKIFSNSHC